MKQLPVLVYLLVLSSLSFGQEKKFEELEPKNAWSDGSILLNDGTELIGLVRYDDRQGIVNYKNGETSRSFTPRSVTAFEFFDGALNKQRLYYALEHEDTKNNAKRPLFFEVVKDFKSFVVLSKLDPVDIETRQQTPYLYDAMAGPGGSTSYYDRNRRLRTEIKQTETIYFMDDKGVLEAYLQVTRMVIDRILYDTETMKNKIVDRDVFEKYFTPEESEGMEKFAEANDLRFRDKSDLIKILEFGAELRENNR